MRWAKTAARRAQRLLATDRERDMTAVVIVVVLIACLPFSVNSARDSSLLATAYLYTIAVYGLTMLWRYTGLVSAGHSALWGIGAYSAALAAIYWDWSFWAVIPLALIAPAITAVILGYPSIRVKGHYFVIITFAFAEFAVLAGTIELPGGYTGLTLSAPERQVSLLGMDISTANGWIYFIGAFAVLSCLAFVGLQYTRVGRKAIAGRENEVLATSLGIAVHRQRLAVFALSGVIAGVAGVLFLYFTIHIQPNQFGLNKFIIMLQIAIIGGVRQPVGPLIGSLIVYFLPEVMGLPPVETQIAYGVVLLIFVLFFPGGVLSVPRVAYRSAKRFNDTLLRSRPVPDRAST